MYNFPLCILSTVRLREGRVSAFNHCRIFLFIELHSFAKNELMARNPSQPFPVFVEHFKVKGLQCLYLQKVYSLAAMFLLNIIVQWCRKEVIFEGAQHVMGGRGQQ